MDERNRELERLAATGDKQALGLYLSAIIRSGEVDQIERNARLGDQNSLALFLQILNHIREIDLNTLWVYPFLEDRITGRYVLAPVPLPYRLRMSFSDIHQELTETLGYTTTRYGQSIELKGAYIVEDLTIEMAGKALHDLHVRDDLYNPDEFLGDLEFSIIRAGSLLLIDRRGTIFSPVHELNGYPHRMQQPMRIYRERALSHKLPAPDPVKRRFAPHMDQYFPDLISGDGNRYAVVLHVPSGRAYSNGRGYSLLEEDLSAEVVLDAMRFHNSVNLGEKATTQPNQEPAWARILPDNEFNTYFVGT